jgi:FkbM family methyltransferase
MKIDLGGRFNAVFAERPFVIVDVGARGGPKSDWWPLREYLRVIGFEPEEEEWKKLDSSGKDRYFQTALYGSKRTLPLHVTKRPGLSSVYPPNAPFLRHFDSKNSYGYEVLKIAQVDAQRMDAILPDDVRGSIDLVKVDVEGCAYEVLKGAEGMMRDSLLLGLQVEAEFNAKYEGQALYGSVDALIRMYPYQLFDMEVCRWKRRAGLKTAGTQGQLMHGDFMYFMDPDVFFDRISSLSAGEKKAKSLKFIALSAVYGIFDLTHELIETSEGKGVLSREEAGFLRHALRNTRSFIARLPKLQYRGSALDRFAYHLFMALLGVWIDRAGFWKPEVRL